MAKKGTASYDAWLEKYHAHRPKVSQAAKDKLEQVRSILDTEGEYSEELNGKLLTIKDSDTNPDATTIIFDGKSEDFQSHGVMTRRMEDHLIKIFEGTQPIEKAKKGSPEYEEWLRKYREKKGIQQEPEGGKNTLKYRRALAGIQRAKVEDVAEAFKQISPEDNTKVVNVNGASVVVLADRDEENTIIQVKSPIGPASRQVYYVAKNPENLTKLDYGIIAVTINKIIDQHPDEYLPKAPTE